MTRRALLIGSQTFGLAGCEAETGLPAPEKATPLRWSPLESRESAMARVRDA